MRKFRKFILVGLLINFAINSGLLLSLSGPVMNKNDITLFDLITSSESRNTFNDGLVKVSQEKAHDFTANFFEKLIDEISVDPNAKGFEGYREDTFDFEARIKEKEEMDKMYFQLYPFSP